MNDVQAAIADLLADYCNAIGLMYAHKKTTLWVCLDRRPDLLRIEMHMSCVSIADVANGEKYTLAYDDPNFINDLIGRLREFADRCRANLHRWS